MKSQDNFATDLPDLSSASEVENPGTEPMLTHALRYAARGWDIFPIYGMTDGKCDCGKEDKCDNPGKHPIPKNGLKSATNNREVVERWWTEHPNANIAVATGSRSGLVVLDIDGPEGYAAVQKYDLPETVTAKTGRGDGGEHRYYAYPGNVSEVKSIAGLLGQGTKVDIRADGGYVILPPSLHVSGNRYEWVKAPGSIKFVPPPDWAIDSANMSSKEREAKYGAGADGGTTNAQQGPGRPRNGSRASRSGPGVAKITENRNVWLTQEGGRLRGMGLTKSFYAAMEELNQYWCDPPLESSELNRIIENALAWAVPTHTRPPSMDEAGILYSILNDNGTELFHDTNGVNYAAVRWGNQQEIHVISDPKFKLYLVQVYKAHAGMPPGTESLNKVVMAAEADAHYSEDTRDIKLRIGYTDESAIWLDLGRPDGLGVRMTQDGWDIGPLPPGHFAHRAGMKELPLPERGGSINALRRFLNTESEKDTILALGWLAGSMNPKGPHAILNAVGNKGSGKTSLAEVFRATWDNDAMLLRNAIGNERDLKAAAVNNAMLIFDNLSGISQNMSDVYCGLATGSGLAGRSLYTNTDENVFNGTRPVIMTSINVVADKSDLIDRSVIVHCPPLGDSRFTVEAFWTEFGKHHAGILGALCDGVCSALKHRKDIKLSKTPRMADFAVWVEAATRAWGWEPETFLNAYLDNRDEAVGTAIENSPIGEAILQLMWERDNETWSGTATNLLNVLGGVVAEVQTRGKKWPTDVGQLGRLVSEIRGDLEKAGIKIEKEKSNDRNRSRIYTISVPGIPEDKKGRAHVKTKREEIDLQEKMVSPGIIDPAFEERMNQSYSTYDEFVGARKSKPVA